MKKENFYLALILIIMSLFLTFIMVNTKVSYKEVEQLHNGQKTDVCEKPCCHIFFNRYCIDCKEYRDNH